MPIIKFCGSDAVRNYTTVTACLDCWKSDSRAGWKLKVILTHPANPTGAGLFARTDGGCLTMQFFVQMKSIQSWLILRSACLNGLPSFPNRTLLLMAFICLMPWQVGGLVLSLRLLHWQPNSSRAINIWLRLLEPWTSMPHRSFDGRSGWCGANEEGICEGRLYYRTDTLGFEIIGPDGFLYFYKIQLE